MAANGGADLAPGPDPADAPAPPAQDPPGADVAVLRRLCPSCRVRRPAHYFLRQNARDLGDLVVNCALCRGVQPFDPNGGNGLGVVQGGDGAPGDDDDEDGRLHEGRAQLRNESEWVLTGLGVTLYFFGWFSIVALFVVIVTF